VRARRSSILFGKFLSQAALLIGLVLAIDLGIFVVARMVDPGFTVAQMVPALLRLWTAAIVYSLAYLALTTLCSSLFRTPAVSLVVNFAALFGFWLLHVVGGFLEGPGRALRHLSPSAHADGLLNPALAAF